MKFRPVVSDRLERKRQVSPCYERAHQEGALVDQACWEARLNRPKVLEYDNLNKYQACLERARWEVDYYSRQIARLEKELYEGWTSIDTSCD